MSAVSDLRRGFVPPSDGMITLRDGSKKLRLPPKVGTVELSNGSKYDIRKEVWINQAKITTTTYRLCWDKLLSLPSELGYTECGFIDLTETRYKLSDKMFTENLPPSYHQKTMTYINSVKAFAGKKGGGSALLKVAVLHSKEKGNEGRLFFKSTNCSRGFYEKNGMKALDPAKDCVYMHLPPEAVDRVGGERFKSFECQLLTPPAPPKTQENERENSSSCCDRILACWNQFIAWIVSIFHRF